MKPLKSHEIRSAFLDFFSSKGHEIVPSSSLVPADDPSLLFTNAGMVQFKKVFLGEEKRPYKRAATCQKCVRAGGKHNDLENVGYTARHHTFFEMLGNFSFGDYFKKEAIEFAWEFLVENIGLPREKLWITVFREDDEAAELWPKLTGISPQRIVRLDEKDNFWAMGDTGPCGPCSEILLDQGEHVGCGRPDCGVDCDCGRFLEIWNLVFMQFFRDEDGSLSPLPEPCIDTGMGLERIAAVCQGKLNNFDTDIFENLIKTIEAISEKKYGQDEPTNVAMRVISDHARASTFLISDGVIPSNEGRGYVLRRIIRRAIRYGHVLELSERFMKVVARQVIEDMSPIYPEIKQNEEFICDILDHEEERFNRTLGQGLKMLDDYLESLKNKGEDTIDGDFVFKLYDTYGLPVDIVQDVSKERGFRLDRIGFEKRLFKQRERSKASLKELIIEKIPKAIKALIDDGIKSEFTGYETTKAKGKVLTIIERGKALEDAKEGKEVEIITDSSPFYAESGGQIGDKGKIVGPSGEAEVIDTQKRGDLICHLSRVTRGEIRQGDEVELLVSEERRLDTARNHTATHLLHAALRKVLGEHVRQSGSLVEPERLRFDFTHFSALSRNEIKAIEQIVNEKIRADLPVKTSFHSHEEAIKLGAMALFGEKYGDVVRVVTIPDFSMELCGGTHLSSTGQIGFFKIVSESSVASGIRRIEAVTGKIAVDTVQGIEDELFEIASTLKCPVNAIKSRISGLQKRIKELENKINTLSATRAVSSLDDILKDAVNVNGIKVVTYKAKGLDAKALRELGDKIRDRLKSGILCLGSQNEDKAMLLCMVTKDLIQKYRAGDIIKEIAPVIKGGGGGRPDMAQAGGKDISRIDEALKKAIDLIEKMGE